MKFTKIKLLIAALALGGTVAAAPVAHAETLTVGTTAQTYPTSYKKGDKLTGFDVAVTKAVAKEMGDKVKFKVVGDIPSLFGELDKGSIDTIANSVTVLPEREKKYSFSPVYSYYAAQIAVKSTKRSRTWKARRFLQRLVPLTLTCCKSMIPRSRSKNTMIAMPSSPMPTMVRLPGS